MPRRSRDSTMLALYDIRRKSKKHPGEQQFLLILAMMLEMGKLRGYTTQQLLQEAEAYQEAHPKWADLIEDACYYIERGYICMPFQPQVEDPGFVAWVATMKTHPNKLSRLDRALSHPSEEPSRKFPASLCSLWKSEKDAKAALKNVPEKDRKLTAVVPAIIYYADRVGLKEEA